MFSRAIRRGFAMGASVVAQKMKIHTDLTRAIANNTDADACLERMRIAQEKFYGFSQKQVDVIFEYVSDRIKQHSAELAEMAVEESDIGCVEDKVLKNTYAAEHSFAMYRDMRTVGVIDRNDDMGITHIAEPVGPICAILPCTNPTSTVIFKSLYSLKTRNCVIFLPHPRTGKCSIHTANLIHRYAVEAGAPEDVIASCVPSRGLSDHVMRHRGTKFLLATGGSDMVRSCYSIGKPAIGVGPGNTPVVIDDTFDPKEAANSVLIGKTFDWGVPCITEQSIIATSGSYNKVKKILRDRGVYFMGDYEKNRVSGVFMKGGRVNPDIVGKPPLFIAEGAGIEVPQSTLALGVEVSGVGEHEVFSHEKMSPILALYRADAFEDAVRTARELVLFGGPGHSCCLYSNDEEHIRLFQERMPAYHVNINMPALGGIGIRYNTNVPPSMTVGCGVMGGSMASVNVGPSDLIQIKTVARKVIPKKDIPMTSIINDTFTGAIRSMSLRDQNVIVIADPSVPNKKEFIQALHSQGNNLMIFNDLTSSIDDIDNNVSLLGNFRPDVVIAIGDDSVIDIAKVLRLRYENKDVPTEKLLSPYIEHERHDDLLGLRRELPLIVVPIVPGSADSTPFTQHITGCVGGLAANIYSHCLRPHTVIYDRALRHHIKKDDLLMAAHTVLLQGIEALVSTHSDHVSREKIYGAVRQIFFQLGEPTLDKQKVLDACVEISASVGENGVGLGTSMASQISLALGVPFASALASVMPHVINYNACPHPRRSAVSPRYPYPMAGDQYSLLASRLGINGTNEEKTLGLIKALRSLRYNAGVRTIHSFVGREIFLERMCDLTHAIFGDPLHSTNPRSVFFSDIQKLYKLSYFD